MEAETFVGLDVSRNGVVATAVDPLGGLIDQSSLGPTDAELIGYLRRLPGVKRVALEACTMWEHFHDAAVAAGADVVLSHPYKTRLIADASLKSDKRSTRRRSPPCFGSGPYRRPSFPMRGLGRYGGWFETGCSIASSRRRSPITSTRS